MAFSPEFILLLISSFDLELKVSERDITDEVDNSKFGLIFSILAFPLKIKLYPSFFTFRSRVKS